MSLKHKRAGVSSIMSTSDLIWDLEWTSVQEIILAAVPLVAIMTEQGRGMKTLTGRRLTSVRLRARSEVRTNQPSLTNEEFNHTLSNIFGIDLPQPLDIENIHIKEMNL